MSRPRVADVRLVAGLLQEEHDNVEELAEDVIIQLDQARTERAKKERHKGLLFRAGEVLLAVGPFNTDKAMERWVKAEGLEPSDLTTIVIKRPEEV